MSDGAEVVAVFVLAVTAIADLEIWQQHMRRRGSGGSGCDNSRIGRKLRSEGGESGCMIRFLLCSQLAAEAALVAVWKCKQRHQW